METKMLSLYDYLGKAAGMELGEKVFKASVAMNIKPESRDVETKTYCGKVMLYPKNFLDLYFQNSKQVNTETLPF
tara:strand:+ start:1414 stop:1638 length:225 start_codon:yes stop_codon:yes gene_type:complete